MMESTSEPECEVVAAVAAIWLTAAESPFAQMGAMAVLVDYY